MSQANVLSYIFIIYYIKDYTKVFEAPTFSSYN